MATVWPVMFCPNMSGNLIAANGSHGLFSPDSTGVFNVWAGTNEVQVDIIGDRQGNNTVRFTPARSSAIYNGSTVQPPALQALPCIRT